MRADLETRSFFNQAASALDLSGAEKDRAWDMMTKAGVGRDDPTAIHFLTLAKLDGLSSDLPRKVSAAGSKTVADTRVAIAEAVVNAMAAIPAEMKSQLETSLEDLNASLAATTQAAIDKEARRRDMTRLAGAGLGVAALVLVALGGGYAAGRNTMTTEAASWAALQSLPDGPKWLALARLNPSLDKVLAQGCTAGEGRVIAGGQVCDLPMSVSAPVATSQGADAVRLSVAEWSNRLGIWGLLGVGALFGFFARGFVRRKPGY